MRDQLKVIIGFGCIWGVFILGGTLLSSFTMGANDTAPEIIALLLYGLTTLPACILAIWYRRASGLWLIALSALTFLGLTYQAVVQAGRNPRRGTTFGDVAGIVFLAIIPALLGIALLLTGPLKEVEGRHG